MMPIDKFMPPMIVQPSSVQRGYVPPGGAVRQVPMPMNLVNSSMPMLPIPMLPKKATKGKKKATEKAKKETKTKN